MSGKPNRWAWLPELMPGVARRLAELKRERGDAFVNECWRRGVIEREPGWFFAREGAIAIGTPPTDPEVLSLCGWHIVPTQALVVVHAGGRHGAA